MATFSKRGDSWRARVWDGPKKVQHSKTFETIEEAELWASHREARIRLQREAERNTLVSLIPPRVLKALSSVEYTQAHVVNGAIPAFQSSGIYFLIRDRSIVYIGKTTDIFLRLSKHRRDGRKFDSFNFLPCSRDDLSSMERLYLEAFMPWGNLRF